MKILIIGAGSIGIRHLTNLKGLGYTVIVVDEMKEAREAALWNGASRALPSLDRALAESPEAAFICTYSNNHITPSIECAKAGCHLLIEKPLSTTLEGISRLSGIVSQKKLITFIGCNMRFHPAIRKLKALLETGTIVGKPLWTDMEFGFYLPFAKKNYTSSYMASRKLSGGVIFDVIHELDYALWLFGDAKKVFCSISSLSPIRIRNYDTAEMIIDHKSGMRTRIHVDYLQHTYTRRCKIVGDKGTMFWDFNTQKISCFSANRKKQKHIPMKTELIHNKMFIDEIRYFFDCIKKKKNTFNNVACALRTLKTALACHESAKAGTWRRVR